MNKVLTLIKKYNYIIFTFIFSLIIIGIAYKLKSVAPLGDNSLLTVDFYHQYGPMLAELFDRVKSGENLIYSFNTGLGLPFFRNFFNYLSSFFNIIIFFFKRKNILISFSIIIALKAVFSAITMSIFLKKKFNFKNYSFIGLSLLYAFSSYFIAYYWNIMWLDGLVFLPIIILGIENIINKDNGILYTISLALMLYSNYFIAYMICLFSVIYFIFYLIIKTKKFKIKPILKKLARFTICSLTAALLVSWALIPMFTALKTTNATLGTMPESQYYYFSLLQFFQNQITGVGSTVFASDVSNAPNTACGIITIGLFILFLLNNKVTLKRKIFYTLILVILLCSFIWAPLDYIWHAFHVPNDLPYRYSFLYIFTLILIGAYSLKYIKDIKPYKVIITYLVVMIYITLIKLLKYDNVSTEMINFNYILTSCYFAIYLFYRYIKKFRFIPKFLFVSAISVECIFFIKNNWDIDHNIKTFYSKYYDIHNAVTKLKNEDEEPFFRFDNTEQLTLNDGAWYDFYGLGIFTSMAYDSLSVLNNDLGIPGNDINSYYYKQNTPIYDLMFDIKYKSGINKDNIHYDAMSKDIYKFNYNVGLMFGVNSDVKNWEYDYSNPFEYQNKFVALTTGIENTFNRLKLNKKEIIYENSDETIVKYNYKKSDENVYFYGNNNLINYIIINNVAYYKTNADIDDIYIKTKTNIQRFESYDEAFVITERNDSNNIDVIVSFNNYLNEEIDAYEMSDNNFIDAYHKFDEKRIDLTEFKENYIKGNISLAEDSTIFTSIPYDEGWHVYQNEKEIKTYKINKSLLGFDLKKGTSTIELKYYPKYFNLGILLSIITTLIASVYLFIMHKKTNKE